MRNKLKQKISSTLSNVDAVRVGQVLLSMYNTDIKLKRTLEVKLEPKTALEFFKRGMNCKTTITDEGRSNYHSRLHFDNTICDELYICRDDCLERIESFNDLVQAMYGYDHVELEVYPKYYRVPKALLSGYTAYVSRVRFVN